MDAQRAVRELSLLLREEIKAGQVFGSLHV